jgi:hypothetical protein
MIDGSLGLNDVKPLIGKRFATALSSRFQHSTAEIQCNAGPSLKSLIRATNAVLVVLLSIPNGTSDLTV